MRPLKLYIVVKFQISSYNTFWDMNFFPVWFLVQSRQTDRQTDRQTESDAYEPTVQIAQVGSKMMEDLAMNPFPKEVCAMPEVLLTKLHSTLIHICGVREDPGKLYQVILGLFRNPMVCIPFKLQYFDFGVRADPAATKLVSFFCKCVWGLKMLANST